MSTAARPTFHAAQGRTTYGGSYTMAVSAKDQAAHTKLKFRKFGQASVDEMTTKDLKSNLEEKEKTQLLLTNKSHPANKNSEVSTSSIKLLTNEIEVNLDEIKRKYFDIDADADTGKSADDFDSSSEDDDDDDDDDEDDEEELQRELERIKAERAESQARKEREEKQIAEKLQRESAIIGNPLIQLDLNGTGSSKVKRKWNDDVVFKNQGKEDPNKKKEFINDTIRNDFHRSFLRKYIK